MSQIKELISQYDHRLTQAVSDHAAVLQVLAEYRSSVMGLNDCSEEIGETLSSLINQSDRKRLILLLIAASAHPSPAYVQSLCTLLALGDQSLPNEQIVDLLYKIPNPKSVPYLEKACSISLSYDAYDEFGVKCLDALAAIDTPEAWAVIRANSEAPSVRMREQANELINWRKLG